MDSMENYAMFLQLHLPVQCSSSSSHQCHLHQGLPLSLLRHHLAILQPASRLCCLSHRHYHHHLLKFFNSQQHFPQACQPDLLISTPSPLQQGTTEVVVAVNSVPQPHTFNVSDPLHPCLSPVLWLSNVRCKVIRPQVAYLLPLSYLPNLHPGHHHHHLHHHQYQHHHNRQHYHHHCFVWITLDIVVQEGHRLSITQFHLRFSC